MASALQRLFLRKSKDRERNRSSQGTAAGAGSKARHHAADTLPRSRTLGSLTDVHADETSSRAPLQNGSQNGPSSDSMHLKPDPLQAAQNKVAFPSPERPTLPTATESRARDSDLASAAFTVEPLRLRSHSLDAVRTLGPAPSVGPSDNAVNTGGLSSWFAPTFSFGSFPSSSPSSNPPTSATILVRSPSFQSSDGPALSAPPRPLSTASGFYRVDPSSTRSLTRVDVSGRSIIREQPSYHLERTNSFSSSSKRERPRTATAGTRAGSIGASSTMIRSDSFGSGSSKRQFLSVESRTGSFLPPSALWSPTSEDESMGEWGAQHAGELHLQKSGSEEAEGEEDIEANAIYSRLAELQVIQEAEIALLPSTSSLHAAANLDTDAVETALNSGAYIALHALKASRLFKDSYVPVKLGGKPERRGSSDEEEEGDESRSQGGNQDATGGGLTTWQNILLRANTTPDWSTFQIHARNRAEKVAFDLRVRSETTIYRESGRLRVFVVDGLVVPITLRDAPGAVLPMQVIHSATAVSLPRTFSAQSLASMDVGAGQKSHQVLSLIPASRRTATDLELVQAAAAPFVEGFRKAWTTLRDAANQFNRSFVYVPGFEEYNAARIRKGIYLRACTAFDAEAGKEDEVLGHTAKLRIRALLENVSMALVHEKVFGFLSSIHAEQDEYLCCAATCEEPPPASGQGAAIAAITLAELDPLTSTPLETLHIVREALIQIGSAATMPLSTDELLPVLAHALVTSRAKHLKTWSVYVQLFRLGVDDDSQLGWVSTSFVAAVEYLLQASASSPPSSPNLHSLSRGSSHIGSPTPGSERQPNKLLDERRKSLPLSAAFAGMSLEEALKAHESQPLSLESSSSAFSTSTGGTDKDGFRVPMLPLTSSSGGTAGGSGSASTTRSPSLRTVASGHSSSDLQIRPQLIVRQRTSRHGSGSGSAGSFRRPHLLSTASSSSSHSTDRLSLDGWRRQSLERSNSALSDSHAALSESSGGATSRKRRTSHHLLLGSASSSASLKPKSSTSAAPTLGTSLDAAFAAVQPLPPSFKIDIPSPVAELSDPLLATGPAGTTTSTGSPSAKRARQPDADRF